MSRFLAFLLAALFWAGAAHAQHTMADRRLPLDTPVIVNGNSIDQSFNARSWRYVAQLALQGRLYAGPFHAQSHGGDESVDFFQRWEGTKLLCPPAKRCVIVWGGLTNDLGHSPAYSAAFLKQQLVQMTAYCRQVHAICVIPLTPSLTGLSGNATRLEVNAFALTLQAADVIVVDITAFDPGSDSTGAFRVDTTHPNTPAAWTKLGPAYAGRLSPILTPLMPIPATGQIPGNLHDPSGTIWSMAGTGGTCANSCTNVTNNGIAASWTFYNGSGAAVTVSKGNLSSAMGGGTAQVITVSGVQATVDNTTTTIGSPGADIRLSRAVTMTLTTGDYFEALMEVEWASASGGAPACLATITASGGNSTIFSRSYEKAVTVTGAANNGSGLVRLTMNNTFGITTGDTVVVSGVVGTVASAANGTWTATVVDQTHIDLQGSTFSGTYTSGGLVNANSSGAQPINAAWSGVIRTTGQLLGASGSSSQADFAFRLMQGCTADVVVKVGRVMVRKIETAAYNKPFYHGKTWTRASDGQTFTLGQTPSVAVTGNHSPPVTGDTVSLLRWGTFSGGGITPVCQWLRDGVAITNETNCAGYIVTGADIGHKISVRVWGSNAYGVSDDYGDSAQTGTIVAMNDNDPFAAFAALGTATRAAA